MKNVKFVFVFIVIGFCQVSFARPVLNCEMKKNPCALSGAFVTLPWGSIPDAAQYPFRQQVTSAFEVVYGYQQATGVFVEGSLIIRDQDPQVGAYWGFIPKNENIYFAMISGSAATGFRMGVKGCALSPRVWSSSCRLTSEEEMQTEIYQTAGINPTDINTQPPLPPMSNRVCTVIDKYQGYNNKEVTVDSYGNPISLVNSVREDGVDFDVTVNFKHSVQDKNQFIGDHSGDYGSYKITVDPSTKVFELFLGGPETYGGSRCE